MKIEVDALSFSVGKKRILSGVSARDEWGKKRLAYEIQKMKEGFYYFIQFDAETTTPVEIENRVRIMENVVRYLCVKQNEA